MHRATDQVTASIVGAHPLEPLATLCLPANSLLHCVSAWAVWAYAAAHCPLLAEEFGRPILQRTARFGRFIHRQS